MAGPPVTPPVAATGSSGTAVGQWPPWRWLALGIILLILPLLTGGNAYALHVVILCVLYGLLAMGLNIVPGFCGLLDLGYVGFYGIGAYTVALLTREAGVSFWFALPLAALNGALWGVLLGLPTLRLTGDYFAIVTFGFSELVVLIIRNELWLTRGPMGLPGIPPPELAGWTFSGGEPFYYLVIGLSACVLGLSLRLQGSKTGRAWQAIRGDQVAASTLGVDVVRYKVLAFAISASIAGLAGGFFAAWTTFVSPDMFKFWESVMVLSMVVLGGLGSVWGAALGGALLVLVAEGLREVLPWVGLPQSARYLVFGLVMIAVIRWRPKGLVPRR